LEENPKSILIVKLILMHSNKKQELKELEYVRFDILKIMMIKSRENTKAFT